ncbi:MAG TPA: hypothetical protein VMV91_09150 [Rhodocyclaceae bacterium]|nr:hypothetical protein [Rhodocyclaceae bacterium]
MNPATIIEQATADGVTLALSSSGSIKATGDPAAVNRWLPALREHKVDIIAMLVEPANDSTSWGWVMHFPDREPVEIYTSPESSMAEVLRDFPDAVAAEPIPPAPARPTAPLTAREETAIRAWLELIEETDTAIIADVLGRCRADPEARAYFTGRASGG